MAKRRDLAGAVGSSCRNARARGIGKACVEALEGRVLLAVTAGEYDAIRSTYPGFNLPADMASINIIEIMPDQLSVANLKSAITTAGSNTLPDLVVLRTTDTQNTITYASSADAVSIDIPSAQGAISIVGFGSKSLTIDAAKKSGVVSVGSGSSTTTVNLGCMTLTRGYPSSGDGGGVHQLYGTLTLTNVTISGNTAGSAGGGVYQYYGASILTNVTIRGNETLGYHGGGVYLSYGTSTLTNVTIGANASTDSGGGVYQDHGTLTLTNVMISGNTTSWGGGVYQTYGASTMTNVTISGNMASPGSGGGVYQDHGTSALTNVTISGNTAIDGGGVSQHYATSTLTNVTITGNTASHDAGGVYQYYGTSTLRNTIVARNAAGARTDIVYVNGAGAVLNGSNNLIGDGTGQTSLVNGSNGNLVGSSTSAIDPKLAEVSSFGVSLSPMVGSPAIDAGDDSLIPMGISTDIYGAARIQGARVNIGAVETVLPGVPSVTYVVTSLGDSIAADGVITLREALDAANSDQAVGDAPGRLIFDGRCDCICSGLERKHLHQRSGLPDQQ